MKSGPVYLGVIEEEVELNPGQERGAVVDLFHRVFHRTRDCQTLRERGQNVNQPEIAQKHETSFEEFSHLYYFPNSQTIQNYGQYYFDIEII